MVHTYGTGGCKGYNLTTDVTGEDDIILQMWQGRMIQSYSCDRGGGYNITDVTK